MSMYTGLPHFLENQNRARKKSRKKYEKLIAHYLWLLSQEPTKWVKNAKAMAEKRMKKYGLKKEDVAKAA